jgi:hypothetical protein
MNHEQIVNATLQRKAAASHGPKQDIKHLVEKSYMRIKLSKTDITVV